MLIQFYLPETLTPRDLDEYLARGWFRNSVMLHNSKVICIERDVFSILNIRLDLDGHQLSKSLRKLQRQNKAQFTSRVSRVSLDRSKEALYQQHLDRFKGFLFESLEQFLHASTGQSVFDTYEVCVYDGEQLVAYSLFDLGETSAASLIGVYDRDYGAHSLGVYTMLLEVAYARKKNIRYYYPGYVLDNASDFDYKLRLGAMEYLDEQGNWIPEDRLDRDSLPANLIKQRMDEAAALLDRLNLPYVQKLNPFYTIGYIEPFIGKFSKCTYLFLIQQDQEAYLALEYLFEERIYQLASLEPAPEYDYLIDMQATQELQNSEVYLTDLLHYKQTWRRSDHLPDFLPLFHTIQEE